MRPDAFAHITAQALVPEQLLPYVRAVGGGTPVLCADCVAYLAGGHAVLIACPPGAAALHPEQALSAMEQAVNAALALPGLRQITVLGPATPPQAPPGAVSHEDQYWSIPLPPPPLGQKLHSLLRRAARDAVAAPESWSEEHAALVEQYIATRDFDAGTRHIFRSLQAYLAAAPDAVLLAARSPANGRLLAFCIGDYSSFSTVLYMFAFRQRDCPPGAADLLLAALIREGEARGHTRLNLGLGVNKGIRFFKQKWGAVPLLPCVETSWPVAAPAKLDGGFRALLNRMFSRKRY